MRDLELAKRLLHILRVTKRQLLLHRVRLYSKHDKPLLLCVMYIPEPLLLKHIILELVKLFLACQGVFINLFELIKRYIN